MAEDDSVQFDYAHHVHCSYNDNGYDAGETLCSYGRDLYVG